MKAETDGAPAQGPPSADVLVIGAGPAGAMAAYAAAAKGRRVVILEKNEKIGKKLFLSGKGRCNITNSRDISDFFSCVVKNPKFLMSAFHTFTNADLLELLHSYGLETKEERGGRVFPVSDHSSDVIKTLDKMLKSSGVQIFYGCDVKDVKKKSDTFFVNVCDGREWNAGALVLATGGLSYPSTGSDGKGYEIARQFGHDIIPGRPALSALLGDTGQGLQGLALKNIGFSLLQGEEEIYTEQGEMLFTHDGISGPAVLSASCYINYDKKPLALRARVDLKPALSREMLDARLLREFEGEGGRQLKTLLRALMPAKLIEVCMAQAEISEETKAGQLTKAMRTSLVETIKGLSFRISGPAPIEEAIVTAGGVSIRQVSPSTMESKLMGGLYIAGEMLDVHALTGGYNLQIAFSTGYLAGSHA